MAAEQLRRLLLKEMGITSWLPRAPLPGAALSHEQCLQNFLNDVPVSNVPASPHAPGRSSTVSGPAVSDPMARAPVTAAARSEDAALDSAPASRTAGQRHSEAPVSGAREGVARLAELLQSDLQQKGITERDLTGVNKKSAVAEQAMAGIDSLPITQAENGAESANVEAFGFSWFNVDKRLAVLTMLPAGHARLSGTCRQMLARLLAALHTPWQSLELSEQSFHWPFADDLGLPADSTAAHQAVDGFIARRLREQNCAMLLVLCDGLPWFFKPATGADTTQLQVHRQFGFTMLVTHSLHAMENDAGLKRAAWQSMQVLRERLNRNN